MSAYHELYCGKLPRRSILLHSKSHDYAAPVPYPRLEVLYGQLRRATGEQREQISRQIQEVKESKRQNG